MAKATTYIAGLQLLYKNGAIKYQWNGTQKEVMVAFKYQALKFKLIQMGHSL